MRSFFLEGTVVVVVTTFLHFKNVVLLYLITVIFYSVLLDLAQFILALNSFVTPDAAGSSGSCAFRYLKRFAYAWPEHSKVVQYCGQGNNTS